MPQKPLQEQLDDYFTGKNDTVNWKEGKNALYIRRPTNIDVLSDKPTFDLPVLPSHDLAEPEGDGTEE